MNKRELAVRVATRLERPVSEVRTCIDAALDEIAEAIVSGERVCLTGFGAFGRAWSPPRHGRHPRTGRLLVLHPRYYVRFTAGASLTARLKALVPRFEEDAEHVRARRVARTMAADLKLYHKALLEDTHEPRRTADELLAVLNDARRRFRERVPERVIAVRDYLEEELAAVLRLRNPGTATG